MSIYRPYHAAPLSLKAAPSDLYDASRDVRHTDKACNKRQNDISVYNLKETASNAPINSLTLTPRLPALNTEPYEHDGAGSLSAKGPRHNNDRDDITEIQILPTTDEVSIKQGRVIAEPVLRLDLDHLTSFSLHA